MDAQDAQDRQDETLLQGKLTRAIRDARCPATGARRSMTIILCILCIHVKKIKETWEPFAEFAIGNDIEAAKVMCCKLRHSPQKAQKSQNEFLDLESCRSDGSSCVFVPFVAIEIQTANGFSVT